MSLALFLLWLILNARLTWDVLLTGAIAVALVMLFMDKFLDWTLKKELTALGCISLAFLYVGTLIREILISNLYMLRVLRKAKPAPVIRTFQTGLRTRIARTVLANSITITPGTITISCEGDLLTVHCLTPELARGLTDSPLEKQLMKMEEKIHG